MNLFFIEDMKPVVNPEIVLIECFKELFRLEYNKQPGDNSGRKRYRGFKECRYLYHMYDYRSNLTRDYHEADRHSRALELAGLPENYKISDKLKSCIDYIKEERDKDAYLKVVRGAQNGLRKMADYYEQLDFQKKEQTETYVNKHNQQKTKTVEKTPDDPNKFLSSVKQLKSFIKDLKELEEQIKSDKFTEGVSMGDKEEGRLV